MVEYMATEKQISDTLSATKKRGNDDDDNGEKAKKTRNRRNKSTVDEELGEVPGGRTGNKIKKKCAASTGTTLGICVTITLMARTTAREKEVATIKTRAAAVVDSNEVEVDFQREVEDVVLLGETQVEETVVMDMKDNGPVVIRITMAIFLLLLGHRIKENICPRATIRIMINISIIRTTITHPGDRIPGPRTTDTDDPPTGRLLTSSPSATWLTSLACLR
jgi:hypothetical protein